MFVLRWEWRRKQVIYRVHFLLRAIQWASYLIYMISSFFGLCCRYMMHCWDILHFSCHASKHKTLLSNWGSWYYWAGHWVQHAECLLALLTFIWAYRKPPATKGLQSALFSLAKTLPKHTKTLPHTQNATPTEELNNATWFFYLFILGLTRLGARTVLHFDLSNDWLEIRSGSSWTEPLPSPKAHLLWLWLIYCWPGISVFFVSNRWNVRCLSDPTCWASRPPSELWRERFV